MGSATSGQFFPGCEEFLLYPEPARIVSVPLHEMPALIAAELDRQVARSSADLEETMGLGQLARLMKVEGVEEHVERWLQAHATEKGHDTVALFLAGFWGGQCAPSEVLVEALTRFLEQHKNNVPTVDTLVLPLHAAFLGADPLLRATIRAALRPHLPLYPLLQRASQEGLAHALGIPPTDLDSRPSSDDFSARPCSDGTPHFVIEHIPSRREVVRVHGLTKSDRTLRVDYEVSVWTLTPTFVHQLIARSVLVELCDDAYRGRATQVQYVNRRTQTSKIASYPPRPATLGRGMR